MRKYKFKPEINKCIFDLVYPFFGILPAAGLKRLHFLYNIKMAEIFHINTDLCTGISGFCIQVIQFIISLCNCR